MDLEKLKKLEAEATPGPWKAQTEPRGDCVLWGPDGQFICNTQAEPHWLPDANGGKRAVMFDVDRRDVLLIEAIRNDLPGLLDELNQTRIDCDERLTLKESSDLAKMVDAAREELAKTRAELDEAHLLLKLIRSTLVAATSGKRVNILLEEVAARITDFVDPEASPATSTTTAHTDTRPTSAAAKPDSTGPRRRSTR